MRSFLKYWLPLLLWLGVILIGSTDILSVQQTSRFLIPFLRWLNPNISPNSLVQIHFFVRKLAHLTEYAILAVLFWRAVRGGMKRQAKMSISFIVVSFACGIFAASDELHQSFVASRTASIGDVLIDICGAFIGLAIFLSVTRPEPQP